MHFLEFFIFLLKESDLVHWARSFFYSYILQLKKDLQAEVFEN